MFDNLQSTADHLKGLAYRLDMPPKRRKAILDSIAEFETVQWHPAAWQAAVSRIAPVTLRQDRGRVHFDLSQARDVRPDAVLHYLVEAYIEEITGRPKMRSTGEAAQYMGLTVSAIKKYVSASKTWQPPKAGGRYIFSLDDLYRYDNSRREPWRPAKEGCK